MAGTDDKNGTNQFNEDMNKIWQLINGQDINARNGALGYNVITYRVIGPTEESNGAPNIKGDSDLENKSGASGNAKGNPSLDEQIKNMVNNNVGSTREPYFRTITYDPSSSDEKLGAQALTKSLLALYNAEVLSDGTPTNQALRDVAYLAAHLNLESYIAEIASTKISEQENRAPQRGMYTPKEASRLMGVYQQLSDYCKSQVSFLNQDKPAEKAAS